MNDGPPHAVPTGTFPDVVPVLTDGRVRLRAMSEEDLPAVVEQSNDLETVEWTGLPQPYDLGNAREFLAVHASDWADPRGVARCAIELIPHDGAPASPFAGIIDLRPGTKGDAWETRFVLHPAARERGAMSGALRLAARWAFDHGAASLYWCAARGHFASWRVAHACGFPPRDAAAAHCRPGARQHRRMGGFTASRTADGATHPVGRAGRPAR
ncbi:GNAT family N-acetyltransferase [Janibacter alittae]|uniref:GNAT family protein n=1 Tax=Janibacter alittae TaxID=3115209 RepID=A0ABZ2MER3_9MICO